MMNVDTRSLGEESEMVGALVSAATLRVVKRENQSGRRSQTSISAGRVSMDDTLDMIKLVVVGDSGVGKTCLMLRFIKDEFVTSTRATVGMDFCTRQLAVDVLSGRWEAFRCDAAAMLRGMGPAAACALKARGLLQDWRCSDRLVSLGRGRLLQ